MCACARVFFGLRSVPPSVGGTHPFGSATSPRITTMSHLSHSGDRSADLFCCLTPAHAQGWSLARDGVWGTAWGEREEARSLSQGSPPSKGNAHREGEIVPQVSLKFLLLCSEPALRSPREGERLPLAEPKGKGKVPLFSPQFRSSFKPMICKPTIF